MKIQIELYRHSLESQSTFSQFYRDQVAEQFWSWEEVIQTMTKPSTLLWYAHVNGQWLGFVFVERILDTAEILYFFVANPSRRLGIGHRLMENLLAKLQEINIKRIFLEVRRQNYAAIRLYDSHGFVLMGERKRYYKDGDDALVYERKFI